MDTALVERMSLTTVHISLRNLSVFSVFAASCLVLRAYPLVVWKGDIMSRLKTYEKSNKLNIVVAPKRGKDELKLGCTATIRLTTGITRACINFSTALKILLWTMEFGL